MAVVWRRRATPWHVAFQRVEPYVVKILTPNGGSGTGFVAAATPDKELIGVATAAHVIEASDHWEQPVCVEHFKSGATVILDHADRFIEVTCSSDTASIVLRRRDLALPEEMLPTMAEGKHLKVGVKVGWVGFPAIAPANLCFFSGVISSWSKEGFYLVDGVAINGISGGPAFYINKAGEVQIIGVVSAYVPNRATGAQLPGLCVIRGIAPLQAMIRGLTILEEANQKLERIMKLRQPSPPARSEPTQSRETVGLPAAESPPTILAFCPAPAPKNGMGRRPR